MELVIGLILAAAGALVAIVWWAWRASWARVEVSDPCVFYHATRAYNAEQLTALVEETERARAAYRERTWWLP